MFKVRNLIRHEARTIVLTASLLLCNVAMMAQSQTSGVITDAKGEPLIGVTVIEQGTGNGTVTDVNGRYTLTTTRKNARLKVSYVGYEDQIITPGQSVSLAEDNKTLNEVVVVGYGTMRRKDVTSSITTVGAKDLNQGVYTDPASLLQGKVAGLTVTQNGNPSGMPSITLRGASSFRSGAAMEPYYVIDGVPGMDLSLVAPEDIESIDVLRDATATAIYGSKAANGVIIITTKKGKAGRTNVSYSGYVAFDKVLKNLDMMNADELRQYVKDNGATLPNDEGASTDWQKEVQRTGISHNHNVSVSGGQGNTSYNASINYMNRQGTIRGTDFHRLNGRTLVQTSVLKEHLNLALGLNASESSFNAVAWNEEGASVGDAMNYYSPTNPVRNEDGTWYGDASISQYFNPLAMIAEDRMKFTRRRFQLTTKAEVKITDGLTWTLNYTYNNKQNLYNAYNSTKSQTDLRNGAATRTSGQGHKQIFETFGNFSKTINKVHSLGLMAGYSWEEEYDGDRFGATVYNFYNDGVGYNNMSYANTMDGIDGLSIGTESILRMISFYGRMNYSYNSRYNFQATVRRDGSSAFGENNRWGTFPSVSAAWRISSEPFMAGTRDVIDDLKLRIGYGVSGNSMGFDAYSARKTYGASGWFTYVDGKQYRTLAANKNANPNLKWEKTAMFNVGLDFSFWGSRLSGTIEYYNKKTSDLIYGYPVSTSRYPYGFMDANVGDITNSGFELTINAVPVRTKDFHWQTSLNLAHNNNVVDKLSNEAFSVPYIDAATPNLAGFSTNNVQRIIEGEPLGTFYIWEFAGFNEDGKSLFYVHDEETNARTGETTDTPSEKDRTIVGNAQPKLNMGWNNTLSYKNWNLNMFFTGVFGNKIFNAMRAQYNTTALAATGKNVLKEIATMQNYNDAYSDAPSDRYLENGSYIRLSTLSLGYTFDDKLFNGWIKNFQVYATMNNVFTMTGYKGTDPEVGLGGMTPGMDWRSDRFPHNRSLMLGLKVNF